ncbi:hypothetical protein [Pantoea stewartii]|uniref:hypothetical protein n=1 Tax=Pantoea stewartii TaxID=66269 RepID=UPI0033680C71
MKIKVPFHTKRAIPIVSDNIVSDFSKEQTQVAIEKYQEVLKKWPFMLESFEKNIVTVRFMMFELMLIWVFFHEVSHHFQGHKILREYVSGITESEKNKQQQAREILADLQAMDLTLAYLKRQSETIHTDTAYLLHCGLNLLFYTLHHRNKQLYSDQLGILLDHPHPVLRAQFVRCAFITIMANHHDDPTTDSAAYEFLGLAVMSIKALHCANIYWCMLQDKNEDDDLSIFMLQSSDLYYNELNEEMIKLAEYIEAQHILIMDSKNNIDYDLEFLSQEVFDYFIRQVRNPPEIFF